MMSKSFKLSALGLILVLVSACSNQYKTVNPGATADEIDEIFNRIQADNSIQGFNANLAQDLLADPNVVYFTRSGTNGLLAESVFSMGDATPFTGFGTGPQDFQNVFETGLSEVSIGFVDALSSIDGERYFMLLMEFGYTGDFGYFNSFKSIAASGSYGFSEDIFEVRFESQGINGETIVLRTFDLDPETNSLLGDNVQFQVYVIDGNGTEFPIGQFSSLAGFGS